MYNQKSQLTFNLFKIFFTD